ncbi:YidC/OXA1 family membrane protein insertase [Skeletonema marinoi]|uniref:YidC/OXA1 family membrane protein insertase n=1 Tax=Skeletonema marinoi TaxID=267567 RepID=A0AAD9DIN4_9STRA|nr:YidC/OXA1 family membrane protein insertase [Skeletonema marinoi]
MASAFAPPTTFRSTTQLSAIDPSAIHDLSQHSAVAADSINHFFSSMLISDLDVDAVNSAAATIPLDAAPGAADAAAAVAKADDNGWFGFLTLPIEGLLKLIHASLASTGMTEAWGLSIIAMTVMIKLLTFPLTKGQLESTNKMQSLQPTIKGIQAKYQSNPEVMNQKIAAVYQENEVNHLRDASLQSPKFPSLSDYTENALDEPFGFLPNLEGPTYGADPAMNWVDGVPSLGWHDTIAFASIPVFLTISQVISMNLMQPKSDDPQQQQANVILKVLPFMVGWFALNVPAALGIYWVVNNIVTTSTTLYVKSTMPTIEPVAAGGGAAAAPVMEAQTTDFNPTPMNERAVGFGGSSDDADTMTTITPIDAEVVSEGGPDIQAAPKAKRSGGKKKKKRRN